jgi:hypothetical protein
VEDVTVPPPAVEREHDETMVDFAVALGFDRAYLTNFTGAIHTRMAAVYMDWASSIRKFETL